MSSYKVSKDSVSRVASYIQSQVDATGTIQKSLSDISKETGMSTATLHRAINFLKDKGIISVIPAKNPNEPQIISFEMPLEAGYLPEIENEIMKILVSANKIQEEIEKLGAENALLKEEVKKYREAREKVVSKTELDDTYILVLKK